MIYPPALKALRMNANLTYLASGFIDLLNSGGATLASAPLNSTAGVVVLDVLTFSGFPKTVTASASGTIASAQFRPASGAAITGITVSITGGSGQMIIDNQIGTLDLLVGQSVVIAGTPAPRMVHAT